jgi:hypothetical protein
LVFTARTLVLARDLFGELDAHVLGGVGDEGGERRGIRRDGA